MPIFHTTQSVLPNRTVDNDGNPIEISSSAWNEVHNVTKYVSIVTVLANTTQRVFNHDLGAIPDILSVEPLNTEGVLKFLSNITNTQFTINLPASQEVDCGFKVAAVIL